MSNEEAADSLSHLVKDAFRVSVYPKGAKKAPLRPGSNLMGNLPEFTNDLTGTFVSAMREQGDIVRLRFAGVTAHSITHPDYVRHVMQEANRIYTKDTRGNRLLRLFLGRGLLTSEGEHWLRQRRIAQPAFHRERLTHFGDIIARAAEDLATSLEPQIRAKSVVDVTASMSDVTLRLVGETLLSTDFTKDSGRIGAALSLINEDTIARIQDVFTLPIAAPTARNRRYRAAIAELDAVVARTIKARRERSSTDHDLLAMLMEAEDADTGERMNDAQLRDEVMTIMLAGHETTANALSWAFYLLSTNPAVRTRVVEELAKVLGGRTPTTADLAQLPYLKMVFDESLRLYPPAHLIARSPSEDDEIGGYCIPKGSIVFIPIYSIHRHPRYWPNPEGFDPTRFAPENKDSHPRYSYVPFGAGPRLCIGQAFALLEAQLILATLLQRVSFDLLPGHVVQSDPLITLRPKGGLPMTVHAAERPKKN